MIAWVRKMQCVQVPIKVWPAACKRRTKKNKINENEALKTHLHAIQSKLVIKLVDIFLQHPPRFFLFFHSANSKRKRCPPILLHPSIPGSSHYCTFPTNSNKQQSTPIPNQNPQIPPYSKCLTQLNYYTSPPPRMHIPILVLSRETLHI